MSFIERIREFRHNPFGDNPDFRVVRVGLRTPLTEALILEGSGFITYGRKLIYLSKLLNTRNEQIKPETCVTDTDGVE